MHYSDAFTDRFVGAVAGVAVLGLLLILAGLAARDDKENEMELPVWALWLWKYRHWVLTGLLVLVAFFGGCACARAAEPGCGECWMVGKNLTPAQRQIVATVFQEKGLSVPCPVNGTNCTCGCISGQPCNCAAPDPVQASVRVDVTEPNGTLACGSGTVIAVYTDVADRRVCIVLTNRHVCPRAYPVKVRWPGNKDVTNGHWLGCDDAADLAALWCLAPPNAVACPPAREMPAAGEVLRQAGYPRATGPVKRQGPALESDGGQVNGLEDCRAAISIEEGDSGSGLFNARGELVGVNYGTRNKLAHAVHLRDVHRFLMRSQTRNVFPQLHDIVTPARAIVQPAPIYAPVFAPFGAPACRSCR